MTKEDLYIVRKLIGETSQFRIYECELPNREIGVLKVAITPSQNGILDREAVILQMLRDKAFEYEALYQKDNPDKSLNYQICFPDLVDTFVSQDQGDRRINVVRFINITDDIGRLVPIEHVIFRDRVRVDPKTSAWIMGKILKLLSFAHDIGISINNTTGENILIERDQHYICFFDWSKAEIYTNEKVPAEIAINEISDAAKAVILLLGGDLETGELLPDDQLKDDLYAQHLFALSKGAEKDAFKAHTDFYKLLRTTLGWRGYHPFTSYSLEQERR